MADQDLFEMRRLEALSNTVFGVAMTLLAYDLPRAGHFSGPPGWSALIEAYGRQIGALALSFLIAGVFWVSHHRRLAQAPLATRPVVMLNLVFLMSIVILPATNGLYGGYRQSSVVSIVYFGHLTIIAVLNALLWFLIHAQRRARAQAAAALFPVIVGLAAICCAIYDPTMAQYVMFLGFASPFVGWLIARRERRPG